MSELIPVVLFAYRRPDLVARTLASLRENQVPLIIAYSDGARGAGDADDVAASRAVIDAVDWTRVEHVKRPANLGLGGSIVDGMTATLRRYDAAICCEDDLRVAPGAYAWICAALRHYAADARVLSVGGWSHPRVTPPDVGDRPYFSRRVNTLFWGTWARAWSGMDAGTAAERLERGRLRGVDPAAYGGDLLRQAAAESARSLWAVRFIAHHFETGGLSLCPPRTMVDHIGYDPRASNAAHDPTWYQPDAPPAPVPPTEWPEPREHPQIAALWRAGVLEEERAGRPPSLALRAVRKVLRAIKGFLP